MIKRTFFLFMLFGFINGAIFAQVSDKQIVNEYQIKYKAFENAIDNAKTATELNDIERRTAVFKSDYAQHEKLLDKALYPETFATSFSKLNQKLKLAKADKQKIGELQEENLRLTDLVDKLSEENNNLFAEIQTLRRAEARDKKSIDSLKALVQKLRARIKERDELIISMIDSMFASARKKVGDLNELERKELSAKMDEVNVMDNIKLMLMDNIKFADAGVKNYNDITDAKSDRSELKKKWEDFGPKLVKLYSGQKNREADLKQINVLFDEWDSKINSIIWKNVSELFETNGVMLSSFDNGEKFQSSVLAYLDDKIFNKNNETAMELKDSYSLFADTLWNEAFTERWLPLLLENNLYSETQLKEVEAKLVQWQEKADIFLLPPWVWFTGSGIIVIFLAYLAIKIRKSEFEKKKARENAEKENKV